MGFRRPPDLYTEGSAMHDARALLDPGTEAVRRFARRGYQFDPVAVEALLSRRNASIKQADDLRA